MRNSRSGNLSEIDGSIGIIHFNFTANPFDFDITVIDGAQLDRSIGRDLNAQHFGLVERPMARADLYHIVFFFHFKSCSRIRYQSQSRSRSAGIPAFLARLFLVLMPFCPLLLGAKFHDNLLSAVCLDEDASRQQAHFQHGGTARVTQGDGDPFGFFLLTECHRKEHSQNRSCDESLHSHDRSPLFTDVLSIHLLYFLILIFPFKVSNASCGPPSPTLTVYSSPSLKSFLPRFSVVRSFARSAGTKSKSVYAFPLKVFKMISAERFSGNVTSTLPFTVWKKQSSAGFF